MYLIFGCEQWICTLSISHVQQTLVTINVHIGWSGYIPHVKQIYVYICTQKKKVTGTITRKDDSLLTGMILCCSSCSWCGKQKSEVGEGQVTTATDKLRKKKCTRIKPLIIIMIHVTQCNCFMFSSLCMIGSSILFVYTESQELRCYCRSRTRSILLLNELFYACFQLCYTVIPQHSNQIA